VLKVTLLYKDQPLKHRNAEHKFINHQNKSNRKTTFPDPVMALAHISRPVNANGIQAAYHQDSKSQKQVNFSI